MFVDCVQIEVSSGKGGAGAVSFRREKFVIQGGPDGGDGGDGGNVYFSVDRNTNTLAHFRGTRNFKAKNGRPGEGRNKSGKKGEDIYIKVPPGTQVFEARSDELLLDLIEDGQKVCFLRGGKGGLGNRHFKSATNQRPTHAQSGLSGESKSLRLELKLIADVGLVGFPNVGKSTLISVLSNARPQIANYEFTTLTPSLGIVSVGDFKSDFASFILADIPGIIEGASEGRGLGLEFLRHIERTKFLLFVLDCANTRSLREQFIALCVELVKFSSSLRERPFGIVISKSDELTKESLEQKIKDFNEEVDFSTQGLKRKPKFILPISSIHNLNLDTLKKDLFRSLQE